VSRPAIAEERLALTERGDVRLKLKSVYRDGTTHVILEPLDFLARLAALVPPPSQHQTRYHGIFAPHHALRAAITPAGRGRGAQHAAGAEQPVPKHDGSCQRRAVVAGHRSGLRKAFRAELSIDAFGHWTLRSPVRYLSIGFFRVPDQSIVLMVGSKA